MALHFPYQLSGTGGIASQPLVDVTEATFEQEVLRASRNQPVMLVFHASF